MRYACLAILVLLLQPAVALAQGCGDHGAAESLQVGYQSMSRWLTAVDATDEYMCFARLDESTRRPALHWCWVVDGGMPQPLGTYFFTGVQVNVLRVDGTRAAAMLSDGTWLVVDFADPGNPVLVASPGAASRVRDLDIAGEFAATARDSVLVISSVAAGAVQEVGRYAPARSSAYSMGVSIHSLDVAWPYCWAMVMEDFDTGYYTYNLVLLDISNAAAPSVLASRLAGTSNYPYVTTFNAVRADGLRACLGSRSENVDTWIHDPYIVYDRTRTHDYVAGVGIGAGVPVNESVSPVRTVGDCAYAAGAQLTYYRLQAGQWVEVGAWTCTGAILAAARTGAWAGGSTGFGTYLPAIPDAWPYLGVALAADDLWLRPLVEAGDHVLLHMQQDSCDYCAPPQGWYAVLDAADPLQLANEGAIATTTWGVDGACAVAGNLAYTAAGIWDWTTRTQVGSFSSPVLAIVGSALWAAGEPGLDLYGLTDPLAPVAVGSTLADVWISNLAVSGNRAVLQSGRVLIVADITDPLAPVELSRTTVGIMGEVLYDLALDGDRLFVALGGGSSGRMLTYVINDAGVPVEVGSYQSPRYTWGSDLELDGAVLYAAVPYAGVEVLDVADAAAPRLIGTCLRGREVRALLLHGDVLYGVSDRVDAVKRQCSSAVPVTVRAFTAAWRSDAVLVTWSMPADVGAVRVLASASGREWVVPWTVEGAQWQAADTRAPRGASVSYELQVLRDAHWVTIAQESLDVPGTRLALAHPQPNPFNPSTRLAYTIDAAGEVDLAVYDVAGRRLRTLVAGWREAGEQVATWDGSDDGGRRLPAGVYMARLATPRGVRHVKLVMLE